MKKQNYFKTIFLLLLFSIKLTAQVPPPYVPTNGLVGWWPFTGNTNDLSGNGNNGTNNGAILTTDRFANSNCAYSFNGSSSTINHNTQLIPSNSSFAISFWVKPILNNTFQEFISQNSSPNAFYVGVNGNNMRCGDNWSTTGVIVSNNIWQHYVIVRNFGLNVKIYRDGLLVATSSGNITLGGIGPLVVGKQYAPNQEYYSGIFDDFGIWNRALTGCEINQLFAASLINPTLTINNGTICAGQNFTINPNGANTYTIQGGNAVVSPSINTTYTVIGTNTLTGCVSQAFATSSLIVNANPIITVNSGAICAGQNFTINPNGANTYTIQGGNAVVSPTSNANYTVVGTTTAGCLSQAFATSNLIVNANPSITVNSGAICAGQNFTINPNGANTYTIQGGNAVVSPSINTSYTVAGTSTAGCLSQTFATSNLTVNPNPTITVNNGTICVGQNFTINPNGANTYTIQGGNAVVSPPSNTSYTVAGTSTAGCLSQAFATSNLTVNANPSITVNSGAICAGQNFTINPNGANTYTIQGGNAVVSPLSNAIFTVAGTSTAGCVSQAFATSSLIVNPNPTITVNNGTICAGENFSINPTGANTYTIQGANAVVSPSISTTYTVIGTNTLTGCLSQAFGTSSLTVNPNPILSISGNTIICVGETSTLIVSGGNTYQWSTGASSNSITINQSPNNYNYTVTGTGTNSCISSATIQVVINTCTGIEKIKSEGVSIYPNPTNGEFIIKLVSVNNTYITITNVLGQIIKTQKAELINQINLNLFEKGVYFISVMDNNQSVYKGSIIKE